MFSYSNSNTITQPFLFSLLLLLSAGSSEVVAAEGKRQKTERRYRIQENVS